MARIIQVFLLSTLFLSIYGYNYDDVGDYGYGFDYPVYDRSRLSNYLNPGNLFRAAARLTYPITSGLNNVVGRWTKPYDYYQPPPNYYPYRPRNRYPIDERYSAMEGIEDYGADPNYLENVLYKQVRPTESYPNRDTNYKNSYESNSEENVNDGNDSESYDKPEHDGEFMINYHEQPESEPRSSGSNRAKTISAVDPSDVNLEPKTSRTTTMPDIKYAEPHTGNTILLKLPNQIYISTKPNLGNEQPNSYYVVLNAGTGNAESNTQSPNNNPVYLNSQGLKPTGNEESSTGYYVVSANVGSGTPAVKNPANFIPANSITN